MGICLYGKPFIGKKVEACWKHVGNIALHLLVEMVFAAMDL